MISHPATGRPVSMSDLKARWLALEAEEPGVNGGEIMYRRGGVKMYHGPRR